MFGLDLVELYLCRLDLISSDMIGLDWIRLYGCTKMWPYDCGCFRKFSRMQMFTNFRMCFASFSTFSQVFASFLKFSQVFRKFFASFRKFFDVFRCFLTHFQVFASFRKFFDVFGPAGTYSDTLGHVQMHLDASRCLWKRSDVSEKNPFFLIVYDVFSRLC